MTGISSDRSQAQAWGFGPWALAFAWGWQYGSLVRAFMLISAQNPNCSSEFGIGNPGKTILVFLRFIQACQRWVIFKKIFVWHLFFCIYKWLCRKMNQNVGTRYPCCLQYTPYVLSKGIIRNEWWLACQNLQNVEIFVHRCLLAIGMPAIMLQKADI